MGKIHSRLLSRGVSPLGRGRRCFRFFADDDCRPRLASSTSTPQGDDPTDRSRVVPQPVPADSEPDKGKRCAKSATASTPDGRDPPSYRIPRQSAAQPGKQQCIIPYCTQPAHRCDIDHITPYNPGSPSDQQTIAHNLHALCRTHHRHKSQGLLQINRNPHDGTTTIT
ncbi:MAG: HNH endonuclease, partial [Micrococcales bacterium]|nr:HNH endonuclease [Micrococcales bacterium]